MSDKIGKIPAQKLKEFSDKLITDYCPVVEYLNRKAMIKDLVIFTNELIESYNNNEFEHDTDEWIGFFWRKNVWCILNPVDYRVTGHYTWNSRGNMVEFDGNYFEAPGHLLYDFEEILEAYGMKLIEI